MPEGVRQAASSRILARVIGTPNPNFFRQPLSTEVSPAEDGIEEEGEAPSSPGRPLPRSKPKGSAARLPFFADNWAKVCSSNFILRIVANGYKLQFKYNSVPVQYSFSPRSMSHSSQSICSSKVSEFLSEGAVIKVSADSCSYVSHIFPVPKKTAGEYRIIFDLTELNAFITKVHFRMDSLFSIMALISPGDFLISVDLSDAYHSVAMHSSSLPFLAFVLSRFFYQFTCLPQGLSSSPRVFTMIMRVVLTFLRSRSVKIAAWIDDFLLSAGSAQLASSHASFTIQTFRELGFLPNIAKSQLTPVQRMSHLGLVWDTVTYLIARPGTSSTHLVISTHHHPYRSLYTLLYSVAYSCVIHMAIH